MAETKWRTDGVRVMRAVSLRAAALGTGRATAFNFSADNQRTWIGTVTLQPGAKTPAHHHGPTEAAVYVVNGRGQIRWGEQLEFSTDVGTGDFVHFAPYVPHQELNLALDEPLHLVSVRSNDEGILVDLHVASIEQPESIF
jgi:uncharacterized RmlC-like cupin family protein